MVNRNALARSSKQPGKTRTINFFHVEYIEKSFDDETGLPHQNIYFVDLPGYGYAKVSKSESAKWGEMVEKYLKNRTPLKAIFLLLDIRHEPGVHDKMLFDWCRHYHLPYFYIATKSDKLKKSQIQKHVAILRRNLGEKDPPLAFSSETKEGRDNLWTLILDRIKEDMV